LPDVAYHGTRQGWSIKALTDKAREFMGTDMGAPIELALAAEVFWSCIKEEKLDALLEKLRDLGLDVPDRDAAGGAAADVPARQPVNVNDYLA
jgi:hypothetical protein